MSEIAIWLMFCGVWFWIWWMNLESARTVKTFIWAIGELEKRIKELERHERDSCLDDAGGQGRTAPRP